MQHGLHLLRRIWVSDVLDRFCGCGEDEYEPKCCGAQNPISKMAWHSRGLLLFSPRPNRYPLVRRSKRSIHACRIIGEPELWSRTRRECGLWLDLLELAPWKGHRRSSANSLPQRHANLTFTSGPLSRWMLSMNRTLPVFKVRM